MVPNRSNEVFKDREIAVMGTLVTCEFPHPFYGIQIRAIRWQKVQLHNVSVFMQPWLQMAGMVPPRVVHNDQHLSVLPSVTHQLSQAPPKDDASKVSSRRGTKHPS